MPKRSRKVKKKQTASAPPRRRSKQFIPIHNSALANSVRDSKVAESIRIRMKEDDTLSTHQITDLQQRRKELLKV